MPSINPDEFDLLRKFIEDRCGIALEKGKEYLIESRLARLLVETDSGNFGDFYRKVKSEPNPVLVERIIDAMTTNETLWFRDKGPYIILEELILPQMKELLRQGARSEIRIWSAACSTGQEPYSIGMIIDRYCQLYGEGWLQPSRFSILGTDISPSALLLAKTARYDRISIERGMIESYRNAYFRQNGTVWQLEDKIKGMATYRKFNLMESFMTLGRFDLVFCRNVAIYFSDAAKRDLFRKIAQILLPGGFFFLGSAESLTGFSADFEMGEYKGALYYRTNARGTTG
ncbi:MAG: protein-glutamate O-methyltransferase CheR [Myxococcales bacterium]|nr:protein-glutamate O-methyltransferase CheR [Myxococcales bacterium]